MTDIFGYAIVFTAATSPVMAWIAHNWRHKCAGAKAELAMAVEWAEVERQAFESQLAERERVIADMAERLNRIIALETPRGSHASKKMAKIARGEL